MVSVGSRLHPSLVHRGQAGHAHTGFIPLPHCDPKHLTLSNRGVVLVISGTTEEDEMITTTATVKIVGRLDSRDFRKVVDRIKANGGKFDAIDKTWSLEVNALRMWGGGANIAVRNFEDDPAIEVDVEWES